MNAVAKFVILQYCCLNINCKTTLMPYFYYNTWHNLRIFPQRLTSFYDFISGIVVKFPNNTFENRR